MVMNVPDKYDKAVAWLTKHPKHIENTWNRAFCLPSQLAEIADITKVQKLAHKRASCLFESCGFHQRSGCLTQVAHGSSRQSGTPKLTRAIRADKGNIPKNGGAIKVKDLPLFANWRRRIDKELAKAAQSRKTYHYSPIGDGA